MVVTLGRVLEQIARPHRCEEALPAEIRRNFVVFVNQPNGTSPRPTPGALYLVGTGPAAASTQVLQDTLGLPVYELDFLIEKEKALVPAHYHAIDLSLAAGSHKTKLDVGARADLNRAARKLRSGCSQLFHIEVLRANGNMETYTIPWVKTGVPLMQIDPVATPQSAGRAVKRSADDTADEALRGLQMSMDPHDQATLGQGSLAPIFDLPQGFVRRLGATGDFFFSGTYGIDPGLL